MQITEQQLQQIKELIGIDPTKSPDTPQHQLRGKTLKQVAQQIAELLTPPQPKPTPPPTKPKPKNKHKP